MVEKSVSKAKSKIQQFLIYKTTNKDILEREGTQIERTCLCISFCFSQESYFENYHSNVEVLCITAPICMASNYQSNTAVNKSSLKKEKHKEKNHTFSFLLLIEKAKVFFLLKKGTKMEAKTMALNAKFHNDTRIIQMSPHISHRFC